MTDEQCDLEQQIPAAPTRHGGTLREAQELLGHSSYTLTADTYSHLVDDQQRATADRIEGALGALVSGS